MKFNCVQQVAQWRLCMGCGACVQRCPNGSISLVNIPEIGIRPVVDKDICQQCGDCITICPGIQLQQQCPNASEVIDSLFRSWGPVRQLWEGHATDEEIRFKGSSGGVVSALALYALEKEDITGVFQVGLDPADPLQNQSGLSTSRDRLTHCAGSRYAPAAGCDKMNLIRQSPRPCVFIGKPCEVAALNKFRKVDTELDSKIAFTISIFCAGTPTFDGSLALLKNFGVNRDNVESIHYRGRGWPGNATVTEKQAGRIHELSYARAWGDILSKHGQLRCRLCPDGTGEFADVACGDPWYRTIEPGEKGLSLVLARSAKGLEILNRAVKAGYIKLDELTPDKLPKSQKSILWRRQSLWGRFFIMRLMGVPIPCYEGFHLFSNWLRISLKEKLRSLAGTFRRIVVRRWRKPLIIECKKTPFNEPKKSMDV